MRVILPELLDDLPAERAAASLADLVRINRYFGGYRTLRSILRGLAQPDHRFSFLDIGAASGDMGAIVTRAYSRAQVVSFDYKPNHLARARGVKVAGDAFHLPFAARSFDYVFCSLFLHHFPNDAVVELLRKFAELARRAVLAIDLERGPLAYRFLPATRWLFRWDPVTLHDGPVSVQAAFKQEELRLLAERAGLRNADVRIHRPWSRLSLVAPVNF